jgi:hypothetical protein
MEQYESQGARFAMMAGIDRGGRGQVVEIGGRSLIDRRGFLAAAVGAVPFLAGVRMEAAGAAPKFTAGPVRSVGRAGERFFEPWIAANPVDAGNLVVVASRYLARRPAGEEEPREASAWFTGDGGATWSAGALEGFDQLGPSAYFADSHAAFAPDGTAFCVFIGSKAQAKSMSDIDAWVFRSEDGGRRWRGPTRLEGGGFDYPRIAAGLDREGKPKVFVAVAMEGDSPIFGASKRAGYGCAVLRSDDGARSFSVVNFLCPTTLHHDPIDSPLVLPDGRLLVGFADYPAHPSEKGPRGDIAHGRICAALSADGGTSFATPVPVCEAGIQDTSVELAVDRSDGPRRGRIYAVRHSRSASPAGLGVQTSDDGLVWTAPAFVPGLRAGPIPEAAAAVSSKGVLGLAWIQNEPGDNVRIFDREWTGREHPWDLYFTASADGGATYSAPLHVTSSRTDPTLGSRGYGTDYIALAAAADGSFHPVWINTRDGKCEIQTVRIG